MIIELLFWFCFGAGQALWILALAAIAIRKPANPTKTRREYLEHNWDLLLIRAVLELPIFFLFRHASLATLAHAVAVPWPEWLVIPNHPMAALVIGFAADVILSFALNKIPGIPPALKERIPDTSN